MINNIVLVSGGQQSDSYIRAVCVCERERDGEQGTISLCYTINPCLSVLDIVVSLNPTLLIYPSPPFPLWYKLVP